ncbi:MAG: PQQ-binding-like beta-propeller repeat protein [Pirellulales bacterium]
MLTQLSILGSTARAQFGQGAMPFGFTSRFELSDSVYLDTPDHVARTLEEQYNEYVKGGHWDDALDLLSTLASENGDKVVLASPRRFVSLREYCHARRAELPAEVRGRYRERVDAQAEVTYRAALAARDLDKLQSVADEFFVSSWGDDALWTLGELALERGQYGTARTAWQALLPVAQRVGAATDAADMASSRLVYPDTDLPAAEINARLVLVSILEGATARAERELADFQRLHPAAEGRLGGRLVKLGPVLASQLAASQQWPQPAVNDNWTTFGGSAERTKQLPRTVDVGAKDWEISLPEVVADDPPYAYPQVTPWRRYGEGPLAKKSALLLSHHPAVVGNLLLLNTRDEVRAYDVRTGRPAWGQASATVFRDSDDGLTPRHSQRGGFGIPRYTVTIAGRYLLARMGSPVTSNANQGGLGEKSGYLVCLDLEAQGRLNWKIAPERDDKWAFEGTPIADDECVYVAQRRSGEARPHALVAAYELASGTRRWVREVAGADTLAPGQVDETTSNLLTLHEGVLYFNTNLGAVAAIQATDGQIRWIHVYRQPQTGDLNQPLAHFHRDLTPCIYHEGRILVAPSDTERILALDAATGELHWETRYAPDALHLLGVGGGHLIASGDRIYWINVASGKLVRYWPDGPEPKGYGRGVLADDVVYWPTRDCIYVFSQQSSELKRKIELRQRDEHGTGGNLLVTHDRLLVAAGDRLLAFGQFSQVPRPAGAAATSATSAASQPARAPAAAESPSQPR